MVNLDADPSKILSDPYRVALMRSYGTRDGKYIQLHTG